MPILLTEVLSSVEQQKLNNALLFFKKQLNIASTKVKVNYEVNMQGKDEAELLYKKDDKGQYSDFIINVSNRKDLTLDRKLKGLAHELIHIEQLMSGKADIQNKMWNGKRFDVEYSKQPWESDAIVRSENLWIEFNRANRDGKLNEITNIKKHYYHGSPSKNIKILKAGSYVTPSIELARNFGLSYDNGQTWKDSDLSVPYNFEGIPKFKKGRIPTNEPTIYEVELTDNEIDKLNNPYEHQIKVDVKTKIYSRGTIKENDEDEEETEDGERVDTHKLYNSDMYLDSVAESLGYKDDFNDYFWKQSHIPILFHCTKPEYVKDILTNGLKVSKKTRGLTNKSVGYAIFTTSEPDEISWLRDFYGSAVVEINVSQMRKDNVMPEVSREPEWDKAYKLSYIFQKLGHGKEPWYYVDSSDQVTEHTVIIYQSIHPKYLKLDNTL